MYVCESVVYSVMILFVYANMSVGEDPVVCIFVSVVVWLQHNFDYFDPR